MSKNDPPGVPARSREEALADLKRSLTDELDRIFDEATISAAREKKKKAPKELPSIEVSNYGRLASIKMPPGWLEGKPEPDETNPKRKLRVFNPPESDRVSLCLYFRGHKVAPEAAGNFKALIEKPAHFLTPSETKSMAEIISDKADRSKFKIIVVATRDLSGLRVLIVEGRYADTGEDCYSIYADADGSGAIIQEIYFRGPKDEYLSTFSEALSAIKSIKWK